MNDDNGTDSALAGLAQAGAGALGIGVGTTAGALIGGPVGAVLGGVSGALLQEGMKAVASDVAARFTAKTEQERMGAVYVLAQNQVVQRLNGGQEPRSESFFKPRQRKKAKQLRSEAEELLEGTFLAARKAYEERKVELLANFYTNVVFREDLDSSHANYILTLMESLTYRQLISMACIADTKLLSMVRSRSFRDEGTLNPLQIGVLFELFQLIKLGLVADSSSRYILGVADINPSELKLEGSGAELYNLMTPLTLDFEEYGYFVNAFKPDWLMQQNGGLPGDA